MIPVDRTTPPSVFGLPLLERAKPVTFTLDNGIRVVALNSNELKFTRVNVIVNGGLIEAPNYGVAMIAPEAAREGTISMSGDKIADILDFNGAELKSVCHSHHTSFSLLSLTSGIESLLPVLADITARPVFQNDSIAPIADRIAGKIEMQKQQVGYLADRELDKLVYGPGHPAARNITPEIIRATDSAAIIDWHRRRLNPASITIFVAGKTSDNIFDTLQNTFGSIKATGSGLEPDYSPYIPEPVGDITSVHKPGAVQAAIAAGIPSVSRQHEDYIPIRLAVMALGGYFGSRLMLNIREDKGLTYGINAYLAGGVEGSVIKIMTNCNSSFIQQVIDEIRKEIISLQNPDSFSDSEMERLRRHLISSLASMVDSPLATMDTYENILYAGTPTDYFEQQQDAIRAMTPHSIADIARRYINPSKLHICVAGDKSSFQNGV
ncbi:MAG: insulinase family protein [Muribaculaceae bacterium]|nr:insulinase family protein [Muribaculaceae bacterium]